MIRSPSSSSSSSTAHIRVKISSIILRNPRFFQERAQAPAQAQDQDVPDTSPAADNDVQTDENEHKLQGTERTSAEDGTAPKGETRKPRSSPDTRFVILGPHTPQFMELSSSDSSSEQRPTLPTLKTTATRQIPSASVSASHSPSPGRVGTALPLIRSPVMNGRVDWVEYSRPIPILEDGDLFDQESYSSQSACSAGDGYVGPLIITPRNSKPNRPVIITPDELAIMLGQTTTQIDEYHDHKSSRSSRDLDAVENTQRGAGITATQRHISDARGSPLGRPLQLGVNIETINLPEHIVTVAQLPENTNERLQCAACGRSEGMASGKIILPCGDMTCATCFSSTLSAVSVTRGHSRCPACLNQVVSFKSIVRSKPNDQNQPSSQPPSQPLAQTKPSDNYPIAKKQVKTTVVMRIDNVAWDLTPSIVEDFLPPKTLDTNTFQAIHILLDRFDGRTKDYVYIEVSSPEAAQLILSTRQNAFMKPGVLKGRKRPVTITLVSPDELISELRPRCSAELHALLVLCQATLSPVPNGLARLVKTRHGPFYALLSVMSKLSGKDSPIYWDLFSVASAAISILSTTIARKLAHPQSIWTPPLAPPAPRATYAAKPGTTPFNPAHQLPCVQPLLPPSTAAEDEELRHKLLYAFEVAFQFKAAV